MIDIIEAFYFPLTAIQKLNIVVNKYNNKANEIQRMGGSQKRNAELFLHDISSEIISSNLNAQLKRHFVEFLYLHMYRTDCDVRSPESFNALFEYNNFLVNDILIQNTQVSDFDRKTYEFLLNKGIDPLLFVYLRSAKEYFKNILPYPLRHVINVDREREWNSISVETRKSRIKNKLDFDRKISEFEVAKEKGRLIGTSDEDKCVLIDETYEKESECSLDKKLENYIVRANNDICILRAIFSEYIEIEERWEEFMKLFYAEFPE